ncbi:TetR/AcrR family transcriptional regulator [Streptomyces sp. NPDC087294]|uniref:TetR/AcrR family transcriptional regulator n=1 Tax=Streptomyces sp. NPDC087294 TaxID=3365777 RepID=UPI0037FC98C7
MGFDGKHELLLALSEDAMGRTAERLRALAAEQTAPFDQLGAVVRELFERCRPGGVGYQGPLLSGQPHEVREASAPLLALFTELMTEWERAGLLRPGFGARRAAALTVRTVMFNARTSDPDEEHPLTADEVWDFCAHGLTGE